LDILFSLAFHDATRTNETDPGNDSLDHPRYRIRVRMDAGSETTEDENGRSRSHENVRSQSGRFTCLLALVSDRCTENGRGQKPNEDHGQVLSIRNSARQF